MNPLSRLLVAAQVVAELGLRTCHSLSMIYGPVRAVIDLPEFERVAAPFAMARDLDLRFDPRNTVWSLTLPDVEIVAYDLGVPRAF